MPQNTITYGNPVPFVLKAGEGLKLTLSAGASGTVSVPGEGISDAVSASTEYFYGKYSTQREVVVTLTAGSADVVLTNSAPATSTKRNSNGQTVLDAPSQSVIAGSIGLATGLLPKTYSGFQRVCSGMGSMWLGLLGDSTTVSMGASNTTPANATNGLTGAAAARYAKALADYLTSIGIPASDNGFFGEGLFGAFTPNLAYASYDSRFALIGTASYYANGAQQSAGGILWQLNASGEGVSYTPTLSGSNMTYDRVRVIYCKRTTGSFTVSNPGGGSTAQTITTTGASNTIGVTDVTVTRGSGVFNLTWASGDNWIIGAIPWDSLTPRVHILTMGNYGDRITSNNGIANNANEWRGGAVVASLGLDACVVDMTINSIQNDGLAGVSAYSTALAKVVDDITGSSADAILATEHAIGTANQGTISDAYVAAIKSIANGRSLQVFDAYATITPYASYPQLYYDTLHLSSGGYMAKARQLGRFLTRTSGWVA